MRLTEDIKRKIDEHFQSVTDGDFLKAVTQTYQIEVDKIDNPNDLIVTIPLTNFKKMYSSVLYKIELSKTSSIHFEITSGKSQHLISPAKDVSEEDWEVIQ